MSIEAYYAPTNNARRLRLAEVAETFAAAGLGCTIELDEGNILQLVFESFGSYILASVEDGTFVFGTFCFHGDDPLSVPETVERVMHSIGFSADEDADY